MPDPAATPKVLLVDDDSSALFIYKTHLLRAGYQVETAVSVAEARALIERVGPQNMEAIVTDYWMPGGTGFDLLRHVRQVDRTLSVIMITAEGEKEHVAQSLREGAHNFLDKPVSGAVLRDATAKAVEHTRRQRQIHATIEEAKALGDTQKLLLGRQPSGLGGRIQVYSRPHAEAGGDFATAYPLGPGRIFVLVSDVSGHDLRAAYYSAYMQGVAHGMLHKGASMEEVFQQLNMQLVDDWNRSGNVELSCAACAADIDLGQQVVSILNCGLPTPFLSDLDGWAMPQGDAKANPLGWFDDLAHCQTSKLEGGYLCFWSDGLEEAAQRLAVCPLGLAHRLHIGGDLDSLLAGNTSDDIVSVRVSLAPLSESPAPARVPLFHAHYSGADAANIDDIQTFVEKSLRIAIPKMEENFLLDALLCLREVLLNALRHGCGGAGDRFATLQAALDEKARTVHFQITDDGAGHMFDFDKHEVEAAELLLTEHRGLVLVKNLASRMHMSARGNRISFDFPLSPPITVSS